MFPKETSKELDVPSTTYEGFNSYKKLKPRMKPLPIHRKSLFFFFKYVFQRPEKKKHKNENLI